MKKRFGNAGLSSMGQVVYSVVPVKRLRKLIRSFEPQGFEVIVTPADNKGARVIEE
jgi:predicted sugar kinase